MKTVQEELQKQQDVRENRTECDHVGYFVGHGFEIITMIDGSLLGVSAVNCMMCGAIFHHTSQLVKAPSSPEEPKGKKIIT